MAAISIMRMYIFISDQSSLSSRHCPSKQEAFQSLTNGYLPLLAALPMWIP
jgi:hypothetical protein